MPWWAGLTLAVIAHASGIIAGSRYRLDRMRTVIAQIHAQEQLQRTLGVPGDADEGYDTRDVIRGLCGRSEPVGWHCHQPQGHDGRCVLTPHQIPHVKTPNGGKQP